MTVQFSSNDCLLWLTNVHFHPLGPSTLDLTRLEYRFERRDRLNITFSRESRQYYNPPTTYYGQGQSQQPSRQGNDYDYNYELNYGIQNQNTDTTSGDICDSDDKFLGSLISGVLGALTGGGAAGAAGGGLGGILSAFLGGGASGGGFMSIIQKLLGGLFQSRSFNGQNQIISKSTGQVVSCNELKSFIDNEYNKYMQNPNGYQQIHQNPLYEVYPGYNGQNVYGQAVYGGYGTDYGDGYGGYGG